MPIQVRLAFTLSVVCSLGIVPPSDDESLRLFSSSSITANVTGELQRVSDTGTLFYACVGAGGTWIELAPAGCPKVTRELLEFHLTQGSSVVTGNEVEATGELVFEKRPQQAEYKRLIESGKVVDQNAIVPVLRVSAIKITTLPNNHDAGGIKRNRDRVVSTTVVRRN